MSDSNIEKEIEEKENTKSNSLAGKPDDTETNADFAKTDTAKADKSKADAPKADASKADTSKADAPKADASKANTAETDTSETDTAKDDTGTKTETDQFKTDRPKTDTLNNGPEEKKDESSENVNIKPKKHSGILPGFILGAIVAGGIIFGLFYFGKLNPSIKSVSDVQTSSSVQGSGFETTQEAVEFYIDALKEGDTGKAVTAFAVESFVENADLQGYCEDVESYSTFYDMVMPADGGKIASGINTGSRYGTVSREIFYQYIALMNYANENAFLENVMSGKSLSIVNSSDFNNLSNAFYVSEYDSILNSITVEKIVDPGEVPSRIPYDIQVGQANMEIYTGLYGAQEYTSEAASILISGKKCYLVFDLVKYGDRWYIATLDSNVAILQGSEKKSHTGVILP